MSFQETIVDRTKERTGVDQPGDRLEENKEQAVEVAVAWNGSVLGVDHFRRGKNRKDNFILGEDLACDFPIPAERLGGQTKVVLWQREMTDGSVVTIPPGSRGTVTYSDGVRVDLTQLVAAGQATPCQIWPGAHQLALPPRGRVRIELDPWAFQINEVSQPEKLRTPYQFKLGNKQLYFGFSVLLHAVLLLLFFSIPPDPEGILVDLLEANNRFVKYMLRPTELRQIEIKTWLKTKDDKSGGTGKPHKEIEGAGGKQTAHKTDNRSSIKGPRDNPRPAMTRSLTKEMAKTAGILSYLSAANALTSPFGQVDALGVDPENSLASLVGNQPGEGFGYGGLGVYGTGRGGGGTGEGTIGLGNLNTVGHGGGRGPGSGYGQGPGSGLVGRRAKGPSARPGPAVVRGSLSKDVIRREVHRHLNEIKFCYEKELAKRPDLAGRVAIKFIISGNGAVQAAAVDESGTTLDSQAVKSCIAQAVRRWSFPQPEGGGVVIVSYPFQLTTPHN